MLKIMVTGANSFLAGNIITELLTRGYSVRGMIRKTATISLSHPRLEIIYGLIGEQEDVDKAAEGCDVIIHVAAITDQSLADFRQYERINVGGTRNVIKAALSNSIKNLIYVSTANAFGYGTKDEPGNERKPVKPPFTKSGYAISKIMAQNLILEKFRGSDVRVIVVNPTFMVGPGNHKTSSNRIIFRALGRKIVFIPPGGKNFIHVGDAAKGTCNAIETGNAGQCYILANENLTYREFYHKMVGVTGERPLLITIPSLVLKIAGLAGSLMRLAGLNTAVSLANMEIISLGNYYSAQKALKELSLPQTPVEKAIEEAVNSIMQP
jgi:dihydroflavonol-4-reductase